MENLIQLKQAVEDLKSLTQSEIKEELITDNLAKSLVEAFESAYRSLQISNNIKE
jgi:hypothetical protein